MSAKRPFYILVSVIAPLLASSCSKYYGCDEELDCKPDRPEKGTVHLKASPAEQGTDTLWLEVREGVWNDGDLVHSAPLLQKRAYLELTCQKRYTAELSYPAQGDSLQVYDSGRLDFEDMKNCDKVCYRLDTLELDLRRADR